MHSTPPVRYTVGSVAAIVQWQNAALWQRMSWVRNPLAAPNLLSVLRVNMSNRYWNGLAIGTGVALAAALVGVKTLLLVRWLRDQQGS